MDIQNGIAIDADPKPLEDSLSVVLAIFASGKLDQGGDFRLVEKVVTQVIDDSARSSG